MAKPQKKQKGSLFEGLASLSFAIFIALTIRWGIVEAYVIPSGSMLPTLLIHDHIFVNKFIYGLRAPFSKKWMLKFADLKRGDVVVFKNPKDEDIFLIKRVVGLPGDDFEYHENHIYINGKIAETNSDINENEFSWLREKDLEFHKNDHEFLNEKLGAKNHSVLHIKNHSDPDMQKIKIPDGTFIAMGDHRDNSADSRVWGLAPQENIIGRAMFVWLSCDETLPVVTFLCDPTTTRWKRFFHPIN